MTTTRCSVCGSTAHQPNGTVLHRFVAGEVVHTAKMAGTVTNGPRRGQGYKVRWDNGHEGWLSNTALLSHGPL